MKFDTRVEFENYITTNSNLPFEETLSATNNGVCGSTVVRCTFSGVTNITFYCTQDSELRYDYLTVGNLDTPCTRSSYHSSMKGYANNTYTYACDTGGALC